MPRKARTPAQKFKRTVQEKRMGMLDVPRPKRTVKKRVRRKVKPKKR